MGRTKELPVSAGGTSQPRGADSAHSPQAIPLTPELGPSWLRPLIDNVGQMPEAFRRRLPADVLAMVTAAKATANIRKDGREIGRERVQRVTDHQPHPASNHFRSNPARCHSSLRHRLRVNSVLGPSLQFILVVNKSVH